MRRERRAPAKRPPECLLSSAEATVSATADARQGPPAGPLHDPSPTAVTVDYGLHGGKGSLYLGSEKKQLRPHAACCRLTKGLTEAQMAKVMAAKNFTVRLRVAAAPRYCQPLLRPPARPSGGPPPAGLAWQQSE